jgi:tRNA dimethylallyltransferase
LSAENIEPLEGPPLPLPKALVLTGATGTGKSSLALKAALDRGGAIINCDSLSFYKGFDIGTAKPSLAERSLCPHYLFDILESHEPFTAKDFSDLALPLIKKLWAERILPIVVGGTGFYIRSLLRGLFPGTGRDNAFRASLRERKERGEDLWALLALRDPLAAERIKPRDTTRVIRALEVFEARGESIVEAQARHGLKDKPLDELLVVLELDKGELDARLWERTRGMLDAGLIEETRALLERGVSPLSKPMLSIGYREAVEYLRGERDFSETLKLIYLKTRQFAKRQRTFFRGQFPGAARLRPDFGELKNLLSGYLSRN